MADVWEGSQPITCVGCGKHPEDMDEYTDAAMEFGYDSADEYVMVEEGTLNLDNGHFLCTPCYVKAGLPTAPDGWRAT